MTSTHTIDIVWRNQNRLARETIMLTPTRSHGPSLWLGVVLLLTLLFPLADVSGADLLEKTEAVPRQALSLADAALRALPNKLGISLSRRTTANRLTAIVFY